MSIRSWASIRGGVTVLLILGAALFVVARRGPAAIDPLPADQVETTAELDGITFHLDRGGNAYRVDASSGKWHWHGQVFRVEEMERAFETTDGDVYIVDHDKGERHKVRRRFSEGFENLPEGAEGLRKLIGVERGWGSFTLQSPRAKSVKEYVDLRQQILEDKQGFRDAIVAPDRQRSFSGSGSLKCVSPPRPRGMITCKASLSTPLIYFRKGDDLWYRARYFAEKSLPTTLVDFECEWTENHAGIRVMIDESHELLVELKALTKPRYQQQPERAAKFPLDRWVEVTVHFHLAADDSGVVQLWQDGRLIVDRRGQTLPLARAIYNSLEVGVSAHSYGDLPTTLWVDDIDLSDEPFAEFTDANTPNNGSRQNERPDAR